MSVCLGYQNNESFISNNYNTDCSNFPKSRLLYLLAVLVNRMYSMSGTCMFHHKETHQGTCNEPLQFHCHNVPNIT